MGKETTMAYFKLTPQILAERLRKSTNTSARKLASNLKIKCRISKIQSRSANDHITTFGAAVTFKTQHSRPHSLSVMCVLPSLHFIYFFFSKHLAFLEGFLSRSDTADLTSLISLWMPVVLGTVNLGNL
jgi:hypothetical protein